MLTEKEQKKLKQILKIEKSWFWRFSPYIGFGIPMLMALYLLVWGIMSGSDCATISGGYIIGIIVIGFVTFRHNMILYRIIKKLYDQLNQSSETNIVFNNDRNDERAIQFLGVILTLVGLTCAYRYESMGLKEMFQETTMYLIFKIIGFTLVGIGLLLIILPPIIRRWRG